MLTSIAVIMTVGVYGLVGGIVKLDDGGLHLSQRSGETAFARMQRGLGSAILAGAPWLMKGLSVAGTAAMFLVGGGILVHGIPPLHHALERLADGLAELPAVGDTLRLLTLVAFDAAAGIIAGALVLGMVTASGACCPRAGPCGFRPVLKMSDRTHVEKAADARGP